MSDSNNLRDAVLGLDRLMGRFNPAEIEMPDIKVPPNPLIVAAQANYASEFHKRLIK